MSDTICHHLATISQALPDNKVHVAIWGRQDPDGPHVGPMNFVIWAAAFYVDKTWMITVSLNRINWMISFRCLTEAEPFVCCCQLCNNNSHLHITALNCAILLIE